ncbi:SsrA-binding protein SmpB [Patescibacteria group bacterium]|nr:SsrA-binding protein SmpB [Patescibacteria group bacterium]
MKIINRKARFNYELTERVEAGIVLSGAEVKSAKEGKASLSDSYARVDENGEIWLLNCHIHPYQFADNTDYQPTRSRKLLLKRKEILGLTKKIEGKNLTLVPTAMYLKKGKLKVELAIGRGKKQWDKRETIKKREQRREQGRLLRHKV